MENFRVSWTYKDTEHKITGFPAAVIAFALVFLFLLGVVTFAWLLLSVVL